MSAHSDSAPSAPVVPAGPQPKSFEDVAKAIDNSPLFMKSLPPAGEMDEYLATQMDALSSLLYEGDAEGVQKSFQCLHCLQQRAETVMIIRTGTKLQRARE